PEHNRHELHELSRMKNSQSNNEGRRLTGGLACWAIRFISRAFMFGLKLHPWSCACRESTAIMRRAVNSGNHRGKTAHCRASLHEIRCSHVNGWRGLESPAKGHANRR